MSQSFIALALILGTGIWGCATAPCGPGTQRPAAAAPQRVADRYYQDGLSALVGREYARAADCFSAYIRLAPQDPNGYINRGLSLDRDGRPGLAARDYAKALDLDPAHGEFTHALEIIEASPVPERFRKAAYVEKAGEYLAMTDFLTGAARQGVSMAQEALGYMYQNGLGISRNEGQALRWYRKAAVQGSPGAQYHLATLYEAGKGGTPDFAKALGWYKKSAAQGHGPAQYKLGQIYAAGKGVPKNMATARQWFANAARNGHEPAEIRLRELGSPAMPAGQPVTNRLTPGVPVHLLLHRRP